MGINDEPGLCQDQIFILQIDKIAQTLSHNVMCKIDADGVFTCIWKSELPCLVAQNRCTLMCLEIELLYI